MPRMRTISQVAAWIRETDPETALTETAIRRLTVTGKIKAVRVGNKYLLDLDRVEEYLHGFSDEQVKMQAIREVRV